MSSEHRLREFLSYEPSTGLFRWIKTQSKRIRVGDVAGSLSSQGYVQIRFDGRLYLAHRLAVFFMTGEWPEVTVDHEDRDRANNRWLNLRDASYSQNAGNMAKRPINTSGFKGVFYQKGRKRPFAQIMVDGKSIRLGSFDTPEEAAIAYEVAAIKYFGEFARAA